MPQRNESARMEESEVDDNLESGKRYPQRKTTRPHYLKDYITEFDENDYDSVQCASLGSVDYCCKVCGIPQSYSKAVNSHHASEWKQAMIDEVNSLKENDAFELVNLPEGKISVGPKMTSLFIKWMLKLHFSMPQMKQKSIWINLKVFNRNLTLVRGQKVM
ncbi:hypothetical protein HOLleu_23200 [Holothuria leucospilota]|uniref:Uncharacterized protein n=1 Tax=Holothuria leucospilota TaxID=206669 RepID=A0A9Q1BUV3_HOLLE|nr:hypothetical protein HOLleu_23200 [Holothuria leucospilota]